MYNISMVATIFVRYAMWHYTEAPRLLFSIWRNLLWYTGHIFSVDTLWRSLFSPWRRVIARHTKRWDLEDIASAILANFVSRIVGAIMRLVLIIFGRTMQLLLFFFGIIFYLSWFMMPFLVVATFCYGVALIL